MTIDTKRGIPLSTLLFIGTALLFAPLVALAVTEAFAIAKRERANVEQLANWTALDLRFRLDNALAGDIAILQTLAASPAIDGDNLLDLYRQTQAILKPLGLYVVLRDLDGQQLLNTRLEWGAELPRQPVTEAAVPDSGQPEISDLIIDPVTGTPVVQVSVPVIRDGRTRYVLSLSLDPAAFAKTLHKADLPQGWTTNLVDRNGLRIARSSRSSEFVGVPMPEDWQPAGPGPVRRISDVDQRPILTAVKTSTRSGWSIVVAAPETMIASQVESAVLRFAGGAAALAVVALFGAILLGRYIVTALRQLTEAAHNLGARQPVLYRPSLITEADTVGEALRQAADDLQQREDQIRVLIGEVSHRSKNMLAVIHSIVRHTRADDVPAFRDTLMNRLKGLAASHDVLVAGSWRAAGVGTLVRSHLSAFGDPDSGQFDIAGPQLSLPPASTQAIGMALHELATNAAKYGALSTDRGKVAVHWEIEERDDQPVFVMRWQETGGPEVVAPEQRGFGHTVIVEAVESSLNGKVRLEYGRQGVVWTLSAPLAEVLSEADQDARNRAVG